MIIEQATIKDIRDVALAMRDSDYDEFLAVSFADGREALAASLVERFGGRDDVLAFSDEQGPVAIGALINARPNVMTLLFFANDRFALIAGDLARWATRELFPRQRAAGVHRIEAIARASHESAKRWIGMLGLEPEGPPFRGYGRRGEAYQQFAWVSDACSPCA